VIARLVGRLVARDGVRAVIDVRDVGYAVHAPLRDVEAWAGASSVEIWVSTDVREDAITLYGFSTDLDRVAFERLRLVDGVGPKVALSALDALGLATLVRAVEADDLTTLARIPGVGKKLAQRLALELKGKLPVTFEAGPAAVVAVPEEDTLVLALARLGYNRSEIARALEGLVAEGLTEAALPDRLRASLRILSRRPAPAAARGTE
jgi:Holliday junction DNA helicase RuvA